MINPMTVMKMLNERRVIIENHPDLYPFFKNNFGSEIPEDTVIDIIVKKPGNEKETVEIKVQESEKKFWNCIREILK